MTTKETFLNTIDINANLEDLLNPFHDIFVAYCYSHAENFAHDNSKDIFAYDTIRNIVTKAYKFAEEESRNNL